MITDETIIQKVQSGVVRASIGFTITERCNLRCAHCYMGNPRPVDIEKRVIDNVQFDNLSFITNATFINKPFFETCDEMAEKARRNVLVAISNDDFHRESATQIGYKNYKTLINNNYEKLKTMYPHFDIEMRKHKTKKQFKPVPMGRAKELPKKSKFKPEPGIYAFYFGGKPYFDLQIDAQGNVVEEYRDSQSRENINFGNIFKTPLPEILIEHANFNRYE
jgi:hypothetical protein